eukprot:gene10326-biopygen15539
MSRGECSRPES